MLSSFFMNILSFLAIKLKNITALIFIVILTDCDGCQS